MYRNSGCTGRSALYYYMYYNGFPLLFKALFAFLCHFFAISLASAGNHAFVPPYHPDTDTAGCKSRLAAIKTVKKNILTVSMAVRTFFLVRMKGFEPTLF